jgi:hypothetical protein
VPKYEEPITLPSPALGGRATTGPGPAGYGGDDLARIPEDVAAMEGGSLTPSACGRFDVAHDAGGYRSVREL